MTTPASPRANLQGALTRSLALVGVLAVAASLLAVLATGIFLLRGYAGDRMELIAQQAAYAAEVAVVFDDSNAVADSVRPFSASEGIRRITVTHADGRVMARHANPAADTMPLPWLDPQTVEVPIRAASEQVGSVRIEGATTGIGTLLAGSLFGAMLALGVAFLVNRLIARRLRSTIVAPLRAIATTARNARAERQFDVQAPRAGISEIDNLAVEINSMLDQLRDWNARMADTHQALVRRANFDMLSGLPNRTSFLDQVKNAIKLAHRNKDRFAILFLDGDRFKEINDRFGHAAGDRVIASIAQRLGPILRAGDVAARLGGDEFGILIHHLDTPEEAAHVCQRILEAMEEPILLEDGSRTIVGLSIGIAVYPEDGRDVETLLNHADTAMYAHKNDRR
jgi:diguanylate cyclase (GGDEF)-like protein